MRKKFAIMRDAVGGYIGADVLRALLALGQQNTSHNVTQLQFVIERAGWRADGREDLLLRRIAELQLQAG